MVGRRFDATLRRGNIGNHAAEPPVVSQRLGDQRQGGAGGQAECGGIIAGSAADRGAGSRCWIGLRRRLVKQEPAVHEMEMRQQWVEQVYLVHSIPRTHRVVTASSMTSSGRRVPINEECGGC